MAADGSDRKSSRKQQPIAYDESTIKTLDALEHIRLRTGMYIGRIGDGTHPSDGVYVLLKEVIDNSVDEFIMGHGKKVEIEREGDSVTVRDFGRGIPLGKVVECVSQINTGAKYNDDVFQFSVGLNGVGTKAVNALSSAFEVVSWREGKYRRATFERGKLKIGQAGQGGRRAGRHARPLQPRPLDLQADPLERRAHRPPALVLRLSQHRTHAHLQRQERSRARAA